jgi:hypothetical protein
MEHREFAPAQEQHCAWTAIQQEKLPSLDPANFLQPQAEYQQ